MHEVKLLFDYRNNNKNNGANYVQGKECDITKVIPSHYLRTRGPNIPNISELEVVRHFTNLSRLNMSIDSNFYPLGSCTMKYNPRINEKCSSLAGFLNLHPQQPDSDSQGTLQIIYELQEMLSEISGMDATTLQPLAGAHSELTALLMFKKYLETNNHGNKKTILIPDSAHGTNPASCSMAGFKTAQIKTNDRGCVDVESLKSRLNEDVAGIMITNPNTLGIFEENISHVTELVHGAGGLVYMDGANMNALIGIAKPGDFGVDAMHFNLHKTFTTPHGGGGPGAGAVCVKKNLEPYLPVPRIEFDTQQGVYRQNYSHPNSIGRVAFFNGNVGNIIRGYVYLRSIGNEGLKTISQRAVLNANYLLHKLRKLFHVPYKRRCMHEFVVSAKLIKHNYGISTLDIVKRLLDYGFHAPTIYFPLIVEEAMLIEPTETEDIDTLNKFVSALERIIEEAKTNPDLLHNAPHTMPVSRIDELKAAREPVLRWKGTA